MQISFPNKNFSVAFAFGDINIENKYVMPYASSSTALVIKALYESDRILTVPELWLIVKVSL